MELFISEKAAPSTPHRPAYTREMNALKVDRRIERPLGTVEKSAKERVVGSKVKTVYQDNCVESHLKLSAPTTKLRWKANEL
jgi:hypothetical protein